MRSIVFVISISSFLGCAEDEPKCVANEMVHMNAPALGIDFYIDKYEASRPDASAGSAGSANTTACSLAGVLPWNQVDGASAARACEASGKRLCSFQEWQSACRSLGANYDYPYAANFDLSRCNGDDASGSSVIAKTGEYASCTSIQKVLDLSGNVREWTAPGELPAALMGGGFGSAQFDLSCNVPFRPADGEAYEPGPGDGFRCCRSSAP